MPPLFYGMAAERLGGDPHLLYGQGAFRALSEGGST